MKKDDLKFILDRGEGQFIEFKESLDKDFASEIVSFANSSGGKIFMGVSDLGVIKEVKISNHLRSQIQDIARNCDPSIIISFETFENILIIDVLEGNNKPYSCSSGFYMRMNANSQKMKRDEIINLAIKGGKIRFDEQICSNFDWKDFDDEKLSYYLKISGISYNLKKEQILKNLNLINDNGITNACVLMFAKIPYKYIKSSKIRCVHFNDNERINILDKKEIDKGIIGNIKFAI